MEAKYVLTDEIVTNLKCSLCQRFLSVPPISIISQDGVKYKCGRCHSIKTHVETRALMYENLAKFMTFPCIYKQCPAQLSWSQVKEHEKKCSHCTVTCPRANCYEEFGIGGFATHFKEKHSEAYHSDTFVLTNVHNHYSLDVLEKDGRTYIVIFDHDDVRYGISVCSIGADSHQFELVLGSDTRKVSMIISEQEIKPFDEKTHCFKCVMGVCKSEFHVYRYYKKGILKRMTTKIDRDSVSRTFRGRNLNYRLSIVEAKPDVEDDLEDELIVKDMVIDEVNDDDDEDGDVAVGKEEEIVRRILECPNCFEYMTAPIYQCVTGHTTCKKCKAKLEKCSTCQAQIDSTRNFALEEVASSLKLPASLDKAQTESAPKAITCPSATCHDKFDSQTISTHFKEKHMDFFHWNNFTLKNVYAYFNVDVLVRYGKTYLVLFDYNDANFGVSVCSMSGPDDCRYEIRLTSEDGKFSILATDQKIVPFDETEHCLKCLSRTCKIDQHKYRLKRKAIFERLTTKFNRDSVNRTFNYTQLNYVVHIIDGKKTFLRELALKKDKIFRQIYECAVCKACMLPPIHQCLAGHGLCGACKAGLEKCPTCDAKIENTRNYILEEVAESVELPCQFVADSCEFRAGIKRVASHEALCTLNTKKACVEAKVEEAATDVPEVV